MSDAPICLSKALLELAAISARAAATADPNQEFCTSFLLPRGFLEGEVVETLHVVWGTRRTAVCGELVRIDINIDDGSTTAFDVRQILRSQVVPLIEGFGGVLQDTPEGFVILSGNHRTIKANCHLAPHSIGEHGAGGAS
jgi:hypothetical protein